MLPRFVTTENDMRAEGPRLRSGGFRPCSLRRLPEVWLLVVFVSASAVPALGQRADSLSTDARLFFAIHHIENPALGTYLHAVDATAYPMFFGAPAAAWAGAVLSRKDGFEDTYRLSVAWGLATASAIALKRLIRRPRPYAAMPNVRPRSGPPSDPFSMPSGHTALAFATAVSWSLSHPRWYVIVPGAVWAVSVGVSRVWLGVHYPGDVLAGALLGTGAAVLVHLIGPSITPAFLKNGEEGMPQGMGMHFRF